MRWLIDGYNLMHAAGAAGGASDTPQVFRRKRRRFLNDLAATLGPRALEATVVFDANSPPADFAIETTFKGLHLIFALGDENADARIEQLIAAHSAPKSLTVVSSDRRVRQAATRRKAQALSSDQFLDFLDRLRAKRSAKPAEPQAPDLAGKDRSAPIPAGESAYWLEQFRELDKELESRESHPRDVLLTDAEIARLEREIEGEP